AEPLERLMGALARQDARGGARLVALALGVGARAGEGPRRDGAARGARRRRAATRGRKRGAAPLHAADAGGRDPPARRSRAVVLRRARPALRPRTALARAARTPRLGAARGPGAAVVDPARDRRRGDGRTRGDRRAEPRLARARRLRHLARRRPRRAPARPP